VTGFVMLGIRSQSSGGDGSACSMLVGKSNGSEYNRPPIECNGNVMSSPGFSWK
jgi:hypothetical protein